MSLMLDPITPYCRCKGSPIPGSLCMGTKQTPPQLEATVQMGDRDCHNLPALGASHTPGAGRLLRDSGFYTFSFLFFKRQHFFPNSLFSLCIPGGTLWRPRVHSFRTLGPGTEECCQDPDSAAAGTESPHSCRTPSPSWPWYILLAGIPVRQQSSQPQWGPCYRSKLKLNNNQL